MIRALDLLSLLLFLLGTLLLGVFGTWQEAVPFWPGAVCLWVSALTGVFTLHVRRKGELSGTCLAAVVAFAAYIIWRGLNSEVAYLARLDLVFCATAFIAWVQMAVRFEKPGARYAVMGVWGLLVFGNLGMGLYQKFVNPQANPLSRWGFGRDAGDAVFGGFFPNSNHLCGFMELTGFFFLAVAAFGRVQGFVRVLCGLVFAAAAANVAFSTSRGGLAFGIGVLVFCGLAAALRTARRRGRHGAGGRMGPKFAVAVVACVAVGWVAWSQLERKFGHGQVFKNLNGRTQVWSWAFEQWSEAPLLGTGARSFEYYERSYRNMDTDWVTWHPVDIDAIFAHNDWLQLLADYGLVGLVLGIAVLALHCGRALMVLWREADAAEPGSLFPDHRGVLVLGALCGLIPFAIHCAADFHMHIGVNAVTAAMVLGFLANPGRRNDERNEEAGGFPVQSAAAVLLAAVPAGVMAWQVVPWAVGDYHTYVRSRLPEAPADIERLELEALFLAQQAKLKAVEADPLNYEAWVRLGRTEGAIAQYFQANAGPGSQSPLVPGYLKAALGRFRKAAEIYPQNPYHNMFVASTLDYLGQHAEAEEWWKRALKWGDGARNIHHLYGDHCAALMRYDEAWRHYVWVLHKTSGPVRELLDKKQKRMLEELKKQHGADFCSPGFISTPTKVSSIMEPAIGIIGGSGLYDIEGFTGREEIAVETPWGAPSDVITGGQLSGRRVYFLPRHGRGHRILPHEINHQANIHALRSLGVRWIICVTAVGSLREEYVPRDIVLPDQFFDRTSRREHHTFFGGGIVAHVGFSHPVSEGLRAILHAVCCEQGRRVHSGGTYVNMDGPAFSTRAESLANRQLGFDVIGMTNLPEAKLAREAEIALATLAMITDYDCWKEEEEPVNAHTVIGHLTANAAAAKAVIAAAIPRIPAEPDAPEHRALDNALVTDRALWPAETVEKLRPLLARFL